MPLPLDEIFRRYGIAKGDLPASEIQRRESEQWCRSYIDRLTRELQQQNPAALSITQESVGATVGKAYDEYRRAGILRATRRRLQDDK
jgi:hypothetical protein